MSIGTDLPTNRGPLINLAEWVCLTVVVLAFLGKIYIKWRMVKHLDLNDVFVGLATLMTIVLCITTAEQMNYGLGQNIEALSSDQIGNFYLTTYLSSLFYVWSTHFAKLAGLHFLLTLALDRAASRVVKGCMIFVGLWMVVVAFVASFSCSLPKTWDLRQGEAKCINEITFWTVHGVMDILTQIPTAFLPVYLLYHVHTNGSTKLFIMLSFSPNILTLPFIILRIIWLKNLYSFTAVNPTWNCWGLILVTCLHANFSIILGTIPFSKPIVDALSIGIITNDIGYSVRWDRATAGVQTTKNSAGSSGRSGGPTSRAMYGWKKTSGGTHSSSVVGGMGSRGDGDEGEGVRMEDLTKSTASRTGKKQRDTKLMIRETRTTVVESEERDNDHNEV